MIEALPARRSRTATTAPISSLVPLLWCAHAPVARRSAANRAQRIDAAILGFRYWMDEPGNDVQWYFSENHALLFHTAGLSRRHALSRRDLPPLRPHRRASSARSAAARVRAWLDHFEAWEMAEFNSAPYFPIDLKGLPRSTRSRRTPTSAERAERRDRAAARDRRPLGAPRACSPPRRAAPTSTRSAPGALAGAFRHRAPALGARAGYGRRFHALPQLALCLRDHGLASMPEPCGDRRPWQATSAQEWRFAQGENGIAALYHYKTPRFRDGLGRRLPLGRVGLPGNGAASAPRRAAGGADLDQPSRRDDPFRLRPAVLLGRLRHLPRVHQYRGLAVARFRRRSRAAGLHPCLASRSRDGRGRLRRRPRARPRRTGRSACCSRQRAASSRVADGPTAGCEIRLPGRRGALDRAAVRACRRRAASTAFAERFAGLARIERGDGAIWLARPRLWRVSSAVPTRVVRTRDGVLDPATLDACRASCQALPTRRDADAAVTKKLAGTVQKSA